VCTAMMGCGRKGARAPGAVGCRADEEDLGESMRLVLVCLQPSGGGGTTKQLSGKLRNVAIMGGKACNS